MLPWVGYFLFYSPEEAPSPLYTLGFEQKEQKDEKKRRFTVLIRERECFNKCDSLCSTAFCGGFLGRYASVSLMNRVYSRGVPSPAIPHGFNIP